MNARFATSLLLTTMIGATALNASAQIPAPAAPSQAAPVAPAPAPAISLSAALEGFYQWNTNRPPDRINLLRAYDTRANTFGVQQAALVIESAPNVDAGRRAGLRVDLQFGQATDTVQGNGANEPRPGVYRHVWQAYGSYVAPWHNAQIDFGKFGSNLGFETNYAKDNNNFSRALLFNFLPFYHMGLRATVPLSDKVTVMYMLTNGVQQTEDFNNFKSNHFTAIVKPAASLTWTASYYMGQEQPDRDQPNGPDGFFRVFDTYASWTVTPSLSLGADVNHVSSRVTRTSEAGTLTGAAAYVRQQLGRGAFAVRYEHLDDKGGLFGGVPQTLQEVTITAERAVTDGLIVRAELRRDWSDRAFFTDRTGAATKTSQPTALIGLIWSMGDKKGVW